MQGYDIQQYIIHITWIFTTVLILSELHMLILPSHVTLILDKFTLIGELLKNQVIEAASMLASHSNEMLLPTTAETSEVLLIFTENVSFIAAK